jgi:membrane associated rhomboid family serine protease
VFLPIRAKNPPESFPFVTIGLILANVLVYALTSNGWEIREAVVDNWGLKGSSLDLTHMFTSMFLHGNLMHLIGNMWFLYLFGFAVEGRLKFYKFLPMYLLAGFGGDLLHYFVVARLDPDIPMIGASGAIMGIVGAAMWMFPHAKITCLWRLSTFDIAMWGLGLIYLGFDLLEGFLFAGVGGGVANFAHVGGLLGGVIVTALFRPKRDNETASEAKAQLADAKDYRILTRMQLAELHKMNPTDTTLILNWAHKCLNDPKGITPDCRAAFLGALPKMMQDCPVQSVGFVVNSLAASPGVMKPGQLLQIAQRLEQAQDRNGAMRMYENVLKDPASSPSDAESALFRYCVCCELNGWWDRAANGYDQIVVKNPLGPFGQQAKTRRDFIRQKQLTTS